MSLTQINKAGLDEIALDHVFTIGAYGSSAYTFQGEGLNGTVNNPTLYLTRGKTYRFENGSGGHPFRIQSTTGTSGTAYNTGVTNNNAVGTVIMEVQHDAPDVLYYQCTSHAAMNGILYITGALADGGVTEAKIASGAVTNGKLAADAVTTAKIANSAITNSKLGDDCVTGSRIADNAVATEHIADQAVTLAKLPHGTSSNNGKFLRANNGADPSFETVTSTTINNNADDRIITGSGTANTLNGESNLTYDSTRLTITGSNEADILHLTTGNAANNTFAGMRGDNEAGIRIRGGGSGRGGEIELAGGGRNTDPAVIKFSTTTGTSFNERMRIDSSGNVGIGTTSPADKFHVVAGSQRNFVVRSTGGEPHLYAQNDSGNIENLMIGGNNVIFKAGSGSTGSEVARISENGGITFNGDTAAANGLDDYEIGTWTPTPASGTFTIYNQAWYIKIGKLVTCYFYIYNFSDTSSSTHFVLGGLPFAYNNSPKHESFHNICVGGNAANMNSSCIGITGRIGQGGTTEMQFRQERYNSNSVNFEHTHLGNCHLHTTFCYEAA